MMRTDRLPRAERHPALRLSAVVFLAALVLQLPLALNPGYYSHDELQWAAFAEDGTQVPWLGFEAFQYRPVTFKLWMALSRALFDAPFLFHGLLVAWGSLNAAMLAAVGYRFGMSARPALAGALAFVLSPFAATTHGWIGCIADLAWVGCALLLALAVQRSERTLPAAFAAAVLTAIALLAKEAAFAMPPLLAIAWWFDGRKPRWLAAMLASGAACAIYLGLRLDVLLHAPREGTHYTLAVANLPLRWLEYQAFPPIVPLQEAFLTLQRPVPAVVACGLWLALVVAVWRASQRLAWLFLLGGFAALLPVLPLASSWNHYAYGFAALAAMTVAAAWPRASRNGRIAIATFGILCTLHGGFVMWRMQQVGRIQAVFSPALAQAVHARSGGVVALRLDPQAKAWIFQRLTHQVPSYDGIAIGDRVRLVEPAGDADYIVLPDGHLQPLR